MVRDEGEIGRGVRSVGSWREASWRGEVEDCEVTVFDGIHESISTSVTKLRPTVIVGVEVAHNDGVTIRVVE